MKKFSSKIISGLAVSLIGLSPIMSTQVSAMSDEVKISQNQVKSIEDCSKEELLQRLPSLWRRLFDTDKDAVRDNTYHNAYLNASCDIWTTYPEVINVVWSFANKAEETGGSYDVAFFSVWNPGGVAYNIVKDQDIEYSRNLVRTLERKVNILESMAKVYRRYHNK